MKLTEDDGTDLDDPREYRRLIGKLFYLTITRLDTSYSIQVLSEFLIKPKDAHLEATLRVVRYLKGSLSQRPFYSTKSIMQLTSFCDAD